jgi:hypothetical protein
MCPISNLQLFFPLQDNQWNVFKKGANNFSFQMRLKAQRKSPGLLERPGHLLCTRDFYFESCGVSFSCGVVFVRYWRVG